MDGSNHTTLFSSQKGPVGERTFNLIVGDKGFEPQVPEIRMHGIIVGFAPQASLLTTKKSSCTGSAQEMGPLTAASWMERNWRSWKVLKANFPKLQPWLLWVRSKKKSVLTELCNCRFSEGHRLKITKQRWRDNQQIHSLGYRRQAVVGRPGK